MKRKERGRLLIFSFLAVILLAAILVVMPALHSHSAERNVLEQLQAREAAGEIEVLIVTSQGLDYRLVSESGQKIVIELPDTRLRKQKLTPVHRGPVAQVRAAQHSLSPVTVWVVIDLDRPASFTLEPRGDNVLAVRIPLEGGPTGGEPLPPPPEPSAPRRPPTVTDLGPAFIMDLHCDSVLRMMEYGENILPFGGDTSTNVYLKVTVPLLKQGGIKAQIFAVYVPKGQGFAWTVESIRLFYDMLAAYPDLAFAGSVADIERNLRDGRISAMLAIEGGEAIENNLDYIDYFHKLGVRYMTLTWNRTNLIADANRDKDKSYDGLSPFGEEVVRRMNAVGMIVDVSHASHETIMDALARSADPVIASHSCAYSVNPHWRNLSDEEIRGICSSGGVVGINFYRTFLSPTRPAYASDIVNHIVHVARIGGIGCPALGSDFDGGIRGPVDLQNIGQIGSLTRELRLRGFTEADIDRVYGRNFLRVLKKMDDKAPRN
jgi:membrane dipeptidase